MFFPIAKCIRLRHVILFAAALLGLAQFFYNKSLWVDDARIALNLMEMSYSELAGELRYNQSAPAGFLMVSKFTHNIAPGTEHAMKVFPLLSYFAAVFLFGKIARILLKNRHVADAALALFAFNSGLLFFSSEIKQYMSDVAITLLISWLALREWDDKLVKLRVLAFAGAACVFFSNSAPFALAIAGLHLAAESLKTGFEKQKITNLAALAIVWGLAFGLYFDLFVPPPESLIRRYMMWYWDVQNPAFVFAHGKGNSVILTARQMAAFVVFYFGNPVAATIVFLSAAAGVFVASCKKDWRFMLFTILPFVLHFVLSAVKIYPFATRFLAWCLPGFVLLAAVPFDSPAARRRAGAVCFAWSAAIASFVLVVRDFPIASRHEVKDAIAHVAENADFGTERVFVLAQACHVFEYYARAGFVPDEMLANSEGLNWVIDIPEGGRTSLAKSRERLDTAKGKCWVISITGGEGRRFNPQNSRGGGASLIKFAEKHLLENKMGKLAETDEYREREGGWKYLVSASGGIPPGAELLKKFDACGAGAHLFDFGE